MGRVSAGGKRAGHPEAAKLKIVEYAHRKPVGNTGAAKALGIDKKRITEWAKNEKQIKSFIDSKGVGKSRSVGAGPSCSTA